MRYLILPILLLSGCQNEDPLDEAKSIAAAGLKDPSSAQFRNIEKIGDVVCGEVNAKNSYGGYVGFQPFSVREGKARVHQPVGDELIDTVDRIQTEAVCSDARMRELKKRQS